MDSGGRFLIDRNIFENDIWTDVVKFRLFIYILGKAAFKDTVVCGIEVSRGQYLISYRKLVEDLTYKDGKSLKKYSLATIKRKIDTLIKEQRIEIKETSSGTLFTIKNYDKYQCFESVKGVSQNDCETVAKRLRNDCETIAKQEELNIINANNANKDIKDNSSKLLKAHEQEEAVIELTLNDKSQYTVYKTDIDRWSELYPAVDVIQELRKMAGWIEANPKKRKTRTGIKKFINSWLSKVQDKGGNLVGMPRTTTLSNTGKPNRFINYEQRSWNFNALDKLKSEILERSCDSEKQTQENADMLKRIMSKGDMRE